MPLPDLIEIVPLEKPVHAEITVPGSKSITNRALILAALAEGEVTLQGALWSEDTQIMVECLQELGFMVNVELDPNETCNRTITVYGKGGVVPAGGTEQQPLELFVGNAGTAARFLSAFVCLGKGVYRLHGVPRMHERPQAALFEAVRELGYRVESEAGNDKLPVRISGGGLGDIPSKRSCTVSIEASSQFASALLLCARIGNWDVKIKGENAEESPYVAMTTELIKAFPNQGGKFQIEPDASSGSYFWAAGWLTCQRRLDGNDDLFFPRAALAKNTNWINVQNWPTSRWQIDSDFPNYLPLHLRLSRKLNLGDSIMTAIVIAADYEAARSSFKEGADSALELSIKDGYGYPCINFEDLERLRMQECERVAALRNELSKCGGQVLEIENLLAVTPPNFTAQRSKPTTIIAWRCVLPFWD